MNISAKISASIILEYPSLYTRFFYKQPGCLALTRKFCPKVKQLAKQPLRVKSETKFPKLTNSLSF